MIVIIKQYPVEAIQWNGNNIDEVKKIVGSLYVGNDKSTNTIIIASWKGDQIINLTDWIIVDVYNTIPLIVVNNNTFNANYQQVNE